jgi:hypothetical protein
MLAKLPSMTAMISTANDDNTLKTLIGADAFGFLRWLLLSFQSHLISVPTQFKFAQFSAIPQFMSVLSDPPAEARFNELKAQFGSMYLWHGSGSDRWHAIIWNRLRNLSHTALQAVGAACGAGIYMAPEAATSFGYVRTGQNLYTGSSLGRNLQILALVEVARVPELKNHGWCYTLIREEACVVRFLFVGTTQIVKWNVTLNPPQNVPTLAGILECRALGT